MSLKELISSLIAPLSARPKSQFYQTITPVSGQTTSYTMPVDGWVQLYGENPTGSAQIVQLWGGQATLSTSTTVQSPATWSSSAIGFYRKGDSIFYSIGGFSEMTLNIFALVGGGTNQILQAFGGDLWLRLNHSFKRFSSSLVAKRSRLWAECNSQYRKAGRGLKRIPLRMMDTFRCGALTLLILNYQTLRQAFALEQKRVRQLVYLCRLEKAIRSTVSANTPARQILDSSSLSPLVRLSFAQGGAL